MVLIIESADERVLQEIEALLDPFKLVIQLHKAYSDPNTVSLDERKRRMALVQKFRGNLKTRLSGYQPSKHDWYQQ